MESRRLWSESDCIKYHSYVFNSTKKKVQELKKVVETLNKLISKKYSGYVYIIRRTRDGLYKIGVSKNPKQRIQQLKTGVPDLEVINIIKTDHARELERIIHDKYASVRVGKSEWFDIDISADFDLYTFREWYEKESEINLYEESDQELDVEKENLKDHLEILQICLNSDPKQFTPEYFGSSVYRV